MRFQRPAGVSDELLLKIAYASAQEPSAILLPHRFRRAGERFREHPSQASAVKLSSDRSFIFWKRTPTAYVLKCADSR